MADGREYARDDLAFARAVTFFDAVFAFALTLLITTVNDFSPSAWRTPAALWEANGSGLVSFAISFAVVVRFWRASHSELSTFRSLNGRLIGLHAAVLFGVVLIPFTTEAMGEPGLRDLPLPVALYAVNVTGIYVLQHLVTIVVDRNGMRERRMTPGELRALMATATVFPVVFLGSILIAYLVSPSAAQLSWFSLFLLIPVVSELTGKSGSPPPQEAADSDSAGATE